MGQLICISKPDRCVETISSPWLESVATVGNYLLFLSSVGLGIKLSIKGGLWEPECSSVRAASEWRPHTPHRHFCPRDLGHQQVCLCFDKKQACSPLEDSAKTISGIMPIPYFLLQTVASELVCCDAESLQAPTGLTGCCLQALILWVWMSGKSSIKLGGLWNKSLLPPAVSSGFPNEDLGTWLSSLRHFLQRLAQDFLPVLPVLFSRKTSCYGQNQSLFSGSWHPYVETNHFLSCFYYFNYMKKRRT